MQQPLVQERGTLIQSVQRAIALLRAFENGAPELGVTELGRKANLHKSTVSRLLATLEADGLVERAPGTDKYRLGFALVRLAGQVTHFGDVRAAARPVLVELAEASRETVNLAVLDGYAVINVDQVDAPHIVRDTNWIGRRTPLHPVANGKALLAFQPPAYQAHSLAAPLAPFTPRTITDADRLRAELAQVRAQGYAVALGELEEGLHAVAAPVRDATGVAIAAVSVSGPAYRVTPERLPDLARLTIQAAARISRRLGFVGQE